MDSLVSKPRFRPFRAKLLSLAYLAIAIFIACQLTQEEQGPKTLTLENMYDALTGFDSVEIALADTAGANEQTLFKDSVDSPSDLIRIPAPGYDGKQAVIIIRGYQADSLVFLLRKFYDGEAKISLADTLRLPGSSLAFEQEGLELKEGDTTELPIPKVLPLELARKPIDWSATVPGKVKFVDGKLIAEARGELRIVARFRNDTARQSSFHLIILPNPLVPEAIAVDPETLFVTAGGAPKRMQALVNPLSAKGSLSWHVLDDKIASISADGWVTGKDKGATWAWAQSTRGSSKADSSCIVVADPTAVASVAFRKARSTLFLGGATDTLEVTVEPPDALQEVEFELDAPAKVKIVAGRIKGMEIGAAKVIARSKADRNKADTLEISILPGQKVDSVVVSPRSIKVYTGGKSAALNALVYGSTEFNQVRWRSLHPLVAAVDSTGKVRPVSSGNTRVLAISVADSLKRDSSEVSVKTDIPTLYAGPDITVSPGDSVTVDPEVSQEYGKIVLLKWDFDGDGVWEGESPGLSVISHAFAKEGEYQAEFLVRDEEGNEQRDIRSIKVSASALSITLVSPSRDTTVNTPSLTIRYRINDVPRSKSVTLKKDINTLVIIDTLQGVGVAQTTLRVTLDTTAPVIRFLSPSPDQTYRTRAIAVAWTLDDAEQDSLRTEELPDSDGPHIVRREAWDRAGNRGSASLTVHLDRKPPEVKIVSPLDGSKTATAVVNVHWTVDGVRQTQDTLETFSDGLNPIVRRARDVAGNLDSAVAKVTYISKAPEVRILSPASGTITAQGRIAVSWSVDGNIQAVDTVEDLEDGPNEIVRRSVNEVGTEGSAKVTVTRTTKGPQVEITSPSPGAVTRETSIRVEWTVNGKPQTAGNEPLLKEGENTLVRTFTDSLGLTGTYSIKVIRDTSPPLTPTVSAALRLISSQNPTASAIWNWNSNGDNDGGSGIPAVNSYRVELNSVSGTAQTLSSFTLAQPAEGWQVIRVQQVDRAGNWSAFSDTVNIQVDRIGPATPHFESRSPAASPSWYWKSGGGGIGRFRYRVDAGSFRPESGATKYLLHEFTKSDHTLIVQERDEVGNWSTETSFTIVMDNTYPTTPKVELQQTACQVAGEATDTVSADLDSQGYRKIFDGNSLKGWWANCNTHTSNKINAAAWGVDTATQALFSMASGGSIYGGVLMTNNEFDNYEMVMDIWPKFGNDAGIFHRSTILGRAYQTDIDYISGSSIGGAFNEAGWEAGSTFNIEPFRFNTATEDIGSTTRWTAYTAPLNPQGFGCSADGCVATDWSNVWNVNGWNQVRIQVFGAAPTVRTWLRKFGSPNWVPLQEHTAATTVHPAGTLGICVHGGGGRWSVNPNWYRNIRIRELDASGSPVLAP